MVSANHASCNLPQISIVAYQLLECGKLGLPPWLSNSYKPRVIILAPTTLTYSKYLAFSFSFSERIWYREKSQLRICSAKDTKLSKAEMSSLDNKFKFVCKNCCCKDCTTSVKICLRPWALMKKTVVIFGPKQFNQELSFKRIELHNV